MIDSIIPTDADHSESAAFPSLDAALRFALGNHQRQKPGTLARFQKRTGKGSIFEDANERAAWAGTIRRRISLLHHDKIAILYVRYAPRSFPCACRRPCCSGWSANDEWVDALGMITQASIAAVPGTLSPRQLRVGIVRRWCGADKVNLGILADRCGVHRNTAGQHAKLIKRWLDKLLNDAEREAEMTLLPSETRSVSMTTPIGATGDDSAAPAN